MLNQTLFTHLQVLFPQVALDRELTNIQIDSRNCGEGSIFFAFKGEHTDGRIYAQEVVRCGGLVVCDLKDCSFPIDGERIAIVEDIYETIQNLTISIVQTLKAKGGRIIGVTGSSGKTFCKNAMVKILSDAGYAISSTTGNFNTELGLFLSLAEMGDQVDYLILELGVGKPGDMDLLGKVISPDLILLLDIAYAHAGNFGNSRDLLVQEKLKIIKYRANNARIIAHENLREDIEAYYPTTEVEYYNNDSVFSAPNEAPEASGEISIYGGKYAIYCRNLYGEHYLENFLGIILVLKSILDINNIIKSIEGLENEPGRGLLICDLINPVDGSVFKLYDSSYNANPGKNGSMFRELESIKKFKGSKVLVLGECREIVESEKFHHEILEFAKEISEKIILIGKSWGNEFRENINNDNVKDVVNEVLHSLSDADLLFVKGSNGTGLFGYFVTELQRLCQKNIH